MYTNYCFSFYKNKNLWKGFGLRYLGACAISRALKMCKIYLGKFKEDERKASFTKATLVVCQKRENITEWEMMVRDWYCK